MTHNIDVDSFALALKYAKICSRKFAATREADSEPAVPLADAIFHLEKDIFLGPIHHPRQLHLLHRVERHLVHLGG